MAQPVNGARGEVSLTIGKVELVIAASMEGLAAVSTRVGSQSLAELFAKLSNVEVATAMAAVELMTVRGDAKAALRALKLSHFPAISAALGEALSHHFKDEAGNVEAAETTTP